MSSDASSVVLVAVLATLRASPLVAAAFAVDGAEVAVWSEAPADRGAAADVPFVVVGDLQSVGDEVVEDENGAALVDESELFVTVHVWSRPRDDLKGGKPEALRIAKAVRKALSTELALDADEDGQRFRVVLSDSPESRHFTDADNLTAHSVVTVRYLVEPSEE